MKILQVQGVSVGLGGEGRDILKGYQLKPRCIFYEIDEKFCAHLVIRVWDKYLSTKS
jgi:hypothetical protein